jgi:hypothetical protein
MRVCLISGINITGYNAATATMFLALEDDPSRLDPVKLYHSEIGVFGNRSVKILEVDFDKEDYSKSLKIIADMDSLIEKFKCSEA